MPAGEKHRLTGAGQIEAGAGPRRFAHSPALRGPVSDRVLASRPVAVHNLKRVAAGRPRERNFSGIKFWELPSCARFAF